MMLDDLLRLVPGLRKFRTLNAATLRKMLDRAKGECTWCGDPVPKPRRKWCSDDCYREFNLRCVPAILSRFVADRDQFVCQLCGRNTKAAQREFKAALEAEPWHPPDRYDDTYWRRRKDLQAEFGYSGDWGQADHIVPVAEGGGLTGPENFQWLCGACHAAKTRQQRNKGTG